MAFSSQPCWLSLCSGKRWKDPLLTSEGAAPKGVSERSQNRTGGLESGESSSLETAVEAGRPPAGAGARGSVKPHTLPESAAL